MRGRGVLGVVEVRVEEDEGVSVEVDVEAGAAVEVEADRVAETGACAAEVDEVDEEACEGSEVEGDAATVAEDDAASCISESWSTVTGCDEDDPALSSIGMGVSPGTSILI